jgi:hypothetical protein
VYQQIQYHQSRKLLQATLLSPLLTKKNQQILNGYSLFDVEKVVNQILKISSYENSLKMQLTKTKRRKRKILGNFASAFSAEACGGRVFCSASWADF